MLSQSCGEDMTAQPYLQRVNNLDGHEGSTPRRGTNHFNNLQTFVV
jgi:hypothetical protein